MTSTDRFSSPQLGEISQERLLQQVTQRIRQSLELPEILAATVSEVRSFLQTDRVMVYQFHGDGSGEVVSESLGGDALPSLQGLHFPADDIPDFARELFVRVEVRAIVDVTAGKIGLSPVERNGKTGNATSAKVEYRDVDPCHLRYLETMGVRSSVVLPIQVRQDFASPEISSKLWGLLISHHTQPLKVGNRELSILQWVVDQVSIAIAQSNLLTRALQQSQQQTIINRVANLLHSLETIQLQHALSATAEALKCSGGRLYIAPKLATRDADLYTCGTGEQVRPHPRNFCPLEEHPAWQNLLQQQIEMRSGLPHSTEIAPIVILDLYKTPHLKSLFRHFTTTKIRGLLVFPLYHRQQCLGSLTLCRDEIETEILWAGYFDPSEKQKIPRQSFETWREKKKGQPQMWTAQDLSLGTALAQQFAIALQQHQLYRQVQCLNTNLERQVQERTAELQQSLEFARVLKQVTDQIRSSLDLNTTLQTIVREVRSLLNTDRMVIYRFTSSRSVEAIVEDVQGNWPSVLQVENPPNRFSPEAMQRYLQGEVEAINNVLTIQVPKNHKDFLQRCQIAASLIAPIRIGSKLWGLLVANECEAERNWKDREIKLLQQLADRAAVAINQAELYQQSNLAATVATEKAFELEQIAQQKETLFRVVSKIRESLDLDTIFQVTATEVQRLLNADRVGVFRFDPDSDWKDGEFVAEKLKPGFVSALDVKVRDRCFWEKFAPDYRQGKIQAVADIYNAGLSNCHIKILEKFQVRANLVIPLIKQKQLWGLLCIHQCKKTRSWTTSEIEFVRQISVHLSVALHQGFLLAQTQKQTAELAQALETLQQAQAQLIQTEKMSSLGQLVAGIAHEINNPVNFIYGNLNYVSEYAENLLKHIHLYRTVYSEPNPKIEVQAEEIELEFLEDDLPKIITSLKVGAERIRSIVLSLRNFSRLDESGMKPVDLHEGIDSTLSILQHRLKAKESRQEIEILKFYDDLPRIHCYASQLNQVFMNIIVNSIDALEERDLDRKTITIRTQKNNRSLDGSPWVLIEISDNGSGMPESVQKSIFNPFFTTKPIGKGTGLGLAISYQIVVEKHQGFLRCESSPGQGTTFKIEIPTHEELDIE
ncbi:GAF domain-containing sensor histidine kinase [Lusitaniella coriacea]|uniref:GAF domain-containing sensor histidine kinase n=1 Tax=Lusitaniella coriacea TaxID=1983105 RepID=UPI003CE9F5DC